MAIAVQKGRKKREISDLEHENYKGVNFSTKNPPDQKL